MALFKYDVKHGMCRTVEYKTWKDMKQRCYNPNTDRYKNYGGRGIKVCERWLKGNKEHPFISFLKDMGPKPANHSIERKNVNGDYEPSNCVWATKKQQSRNKQNTVWIEYKGTNKTVQEWAENLGTTANLLNRRLKWGWSVFETLGLSDTKGRQPTKHYHFSRRLIKLRNMVRKQKKEGG